MKRIAILGSTGSIGTQTLKVIKNLKGFRVVLISAHNNVNLLAKQIKEFKPKYAMITNEKINQLSQLFPERSEAKSKGSSASATKFYPSTSSGNKILAFKTKIFLGAKYLEKLLKTKEIDLVVNALVGASGIVPTVKAIEAGKDVGLANKESLVSAGEIIMRKAKEHKVKIFPIDSEHSAIWQCLLGEDPKNIKKIILTCSGGPFLGKTKKELENVKLNQVLRHPTWRMGKKITVDSATLMNKGFEVIEACHLFNVPLDKVEAVIHPESIIHSLVEFCDESYKAQLACHDMRIPIQFALTYPVRQKSNCKSLSLPDLHKLTFRKPDLTTFPCLSYALRAKKTGGTMPAVLNAANEEAVNLFLNNRIKFLDIPRLIEKILDQHKVLKSPSLSQILEADRWVREKVISGE
jgi:1-deoxy-D-xylulose-5-phosphate reductoisomerase